MRKQKLGPSAARAKIITLIIGWIWPGSETLMKQRAGTLGFTKESPVQVITSHKYCPIQVSGKGNDFC